MKLTVKGELTSLNEYINVERGNKYGAASIKRDETERVVYAARTQKLQARLRKCDFHFVWYVKDKRKDPDNIMFSQKFIFDGLVLAGVLFGDTQEWVGKTTHEIKIDKLNPRVEVQIV